MRVESRVENSMRLRAVFLRRSPARSSVHCPVLKGWAWS